MNKKLAKLKAKTPMIMAALIISTAMSGCATVDLNALAKPAEYKVASETEKNVVQRAAQSLNTVFRDRGFVASVSRKRLQSAASVLLNGLEDKQIIEAEDVGYVAMSKPADVVMSDIIFARSYVDRTVAAAEIYLEIAPAKRDLRDELSSLEKALLASTEAGNVFEQSLKGAALHEQGGSELAIFEASVANLRNITDEFGIRVRERDTEKLASRNLNVSS